MCELSLALDDSEAAFLCCFSVKQRLLLGLAPYQGQEDLKWLLRVHEELREDSSRVSVKSLQGSICCLFLARSRFVESRCKPLPM